VPRRAKSPKAAQASFREKFAGRLTLRFDSYPQVGLCRVIANWASNGLLGHLNLILDEQLGNLLLIQNPTRALGRLLD
jgi:hypothetical protein